MSTSILFIASSFDQVNTIKNALYEEGYSFEVIQAVMDSALEIASKYVSEYGTKVIAARGGTAKLLRQYLSVPVVDIRFSFQDFHLSIKMAQSLASNIAVVGYHDYCEFARYYENVIHAGLVIMEWNENSYSEDKLLIEMLPLKKHKVELIVGGKPVENIAKILGMRYLPSQIDPQSVHEAIKEAVHNLNITNAQHERYEMMEAILNSASDAILFINQNGEIVHINNVAQQLLSYKGERNINSFLPQSLVGNVLKGLETCVNRVLTVLGTPMIVNIKCVPASNGVSGVITLQSKVEIQSLSHKLEMDSKLKGHLAHYSFDDIIHSSSSMDRLLEVAKKYAISDGTISLYGETGTGKEMFAQSIHNYSKRKKHPFVAINCAALPENLLESELFGYVGGAFTGANKEGKMGVFEQAQHGTVFLDEIGDIPLSFQVKLLRVIQEKELLKIGNDKTTAIDVRIIVASNKSLKECVENGSFRKDLYYRLSTLELEIPPLRERMEDIPFLVENFLSAKRSAFSIRPEVMKFLVTLNYPGNIRQLFNLLERILVISDSTEISLKTAQEAVYGIHVIQRTNQTLNQEPTLKTQEINSEFSALLNAQKKADGNRKEMAKLLGISSATLWRKMKRTGLL